MGVFAVIKWKNGYHWKTEFAGDLQDYLKDRDIICKAIKNKNGSKGFYYKIQVSSEIVTFKEFSPTIPHLKAVQLYLTMLGNRAKIITGYRTFEIN